eukprot:scaffold99943_cov39-Prasinocladus_malaysianus.AAC.1
MIFFFHVENGRINWVVPVVLFFLSSVLPILQEVSIQYVWSTRAAAGHRYREDGQASAGLWDPNNAWFWIPYCVIFGIGLP